MHGIRGREPIKNNCSQVGILKFRVMPLYDINMKRVCRTRRRFVFVEAFHEEDLEN